MTIINTDSRTLLEVLEALKRGEWLVLSVWDSPCAAPVTQTALEFSDGVWQQFELNCTSSSMLGLGTCNCVSHAPYIAHRVTRQQALAIIRGYLAAQRAEWQARQAEITWLDAQIAQLAAPSESAGHVAGAAHDQHYGDVHD